MIPVMLAGILFARKSYSFTKYLNMVLISIGISIFFLDSSSNKIHIEHEDRNLGIILLVLSLIFDALTNGFQEKMNSDKTTKPTSDELMYYMNAFATVYLGIALVVTGELLPAIQFCIEYREALIDISLLAITMCAGQVFIFWAISDFGNLVATLLTTTRKFFTIIFSVFWFRNPVTNGQWVGIALVFVSLFIDSYVSFMDHRAKDKEKEAQKSQ
jgi:UDP-galactose transporter B1